MQIIDIVVACSLRNYNICIVIIIIIIFYCTSDCEDKMNFLYKNIQFLHVHSLTFSSRKKKTKPFGNNSSRNGEAVLVLTWPGFHVGNLSRRNKISRKLFKIKVSWNFSIFFFHSPHSRHSPIPRQKS